MRSILVTALLTISIVPWAVADHAQPDETGGTITFDHRGGNEWWVEVKVRLNTTEPGSVHVDRVEARDDGGDWKTLTLRSWGNYAGSFHIEPGHRVQFRAAQHGGMSDARIWESCWFAHPAGTEDCGTSPEEFDATFTSVKGNAWWVQTSVRATGGSLAKVDVSINEGAWRPLTDRGWGWAASYSAPEGSLVQFRATSSGGATDLSDCYRWTAATLTSCSSPPVTQFDATFSSVRGNEWWVETDVTVTEGVLVGVDARVNGGTWIPLEKTSWGSWAKSFHVATGSSVEFRARSANAETDQSGTYAWPPG